MTDWLPTLYSAAGGDTSSNHKLQKVDGIDQWEAILNGGPSRRKEMLYGTENDKAAIRYKVQ